MTDPTTEPDEQLVEAVARALGGPMMMRCDGCDGCTWTRCASCPQPGQPCTCAGIPGADPELARITIAAVRAWDSERGTRAAVMALCRLLGHDPRDVKHLAIDAADGVTLTLYKRLAGGGIALDPGGLTAVTITATHPLDPA